MIAASIFAAAAAVAQDAAPEIPPAAKSPADFATDIHPLLAERCYTCHADDQRKGGLRLDVAGRIA